MLINREFLEAHSDSDRPIGLILEDDEGWTLSIAPTFVVEKTARLEHTLFTDPLNLGEANPALFSIEISTDLETIVNYFHSSFNPKSERIGVRAYYRFPTGEEYSWEDVDFFCGYVDSIEMTNAYTGQTRLVCYDRLKWCCEQKVGMAAFTCFYSWNYTFIGGWESGMQYAKNKYPERVWDNYTDVMLFDDDTWYVYVTMRRLLSDCDTMTPAQAAAAGYAHQITAAEAYSTPAASSRTVGALLNAMRVQVGLGLDFTDMDCRDLEGQEGTTVFPVNYDLVLDRLPVHFDWETIKSLTFGDLLRPLLALMGCYAYLKPGSTYYLMIVGDGARLPRYETDPSTGQIIHYYRTQIDDITADIQPGSIRTTSARVGRVPRGFTCVPMDYTGKEMWPTSVGAGYRDEDDLQRYFFRNTILDAIIDPGGGITRVMHAIGFDETGGRNSLDEYLGDCPYLDFEHVFTHRIGFEYDMIASDPTTRANLVTAPISGSGLDPDDDTPVTRTFTGRVAKVTYTGQGLYQQHCVVLPVNAQYTKEAYHCDNLYSILSWEAEHKTS